MSMPYCAFPLCHSLDVEPCKIYGDDGSQHRQRTDKNNGGVACQRVSEHQPKSPKLALRKYWLLHQILGFTIPDEVQRE